MGGIRKKLSEKRLAGRRGAYDSTKLTDGEKAARKRPGSNKKSWPTRGSR